MRLRDERSYDGRTPSALGVRPNRLFSISCVAPQRLASLAKYFSLGAAVMKWVSVSLTAGLALAVSCCASQQQLVRQKEDLLAAAGFQVRVADTPQRLAAMKSLPPNKFVTSVRDGRPIYKYADPLVCRCVYFGTQQNWDAYRQEVFAQQLANEAQMTAMMNQEAWDWGPWGWP